MSFPENDAGFSILETLVALTIMGLAGVVLLKGFGNQARAMALAAEAHEAVREMQILIDTAKPGDADGEGRSVSPVGDLGWRRTVSPLGQGLVRIRVSVEGLGDRRYTAEAIRWDQEISEVPLP